MNMKKIKIILKISFLLFSGITILNSCNSSTKNTKTSNKTQGVKYDTLELNENEFEKKYSIRTLVVNKKTVHYFIKGDTTIMNCKYNHLYDKLFKNADVYYRAEDTTIKIDRINNNLFYVFIPKTYSRNRLLFQSFIQPHKNYFIKSTFSNQLINSTNFTTVSTLLYMVK